MKKNKKNTEVNNTAETGDSSIARKIEKLAVKNEKRRIKICKVRIISGLDGDDSCHMYFPGYPARNEPVGCCGVSMTTLIMGDIKPSGPNDLGMLGAGVMTPQKKVSIWDPNRKCKVRVDAKLAGLVKALFPCFDVVNCFRMQGSRVGLVFGSKRDGTVFGSLTCDELAAKSKSDWHNGSVGEHTYFGFPEYELNKVIRLIERYKAWGGAVEGIEDN